MSSINSMLYLVMHRFIMIVMVKVWKFHFAKMINFLFIVFFYIHAVLAVRIPQSIDHLLHSSCNPQPSLSSSKREPLVPSIVSAPTSCPDDILFVVFVHGIMGFQRNGDFLESSIIQRQPISVSDRNTALFVLKSQANEGRRSLQGIDNAAKRLLDEIDEFYSAQIESLLRRKCESSTSSFGQSVNIYLSMVGESMGGLVARYVIGLLNERGFKVRSENIEDAANVPVYIPLSFMTISSPHLGVDRAVRGCITAAWNCVGGSLCCYRSTKQLFIKDPETLLNNMAQPQSSFLNGLLQFQHRTLVGHRQDLTVPVGSALIAADRDYDVKNNCNVVKVSIHPDQTESSHANDDLLKNSLNSQFYQIELCRQDAIGYPRPSPAISQTMRRGPQIKYHEQSAESLQSMQWRRVLVGYKKMWWFPQTYIHHSILGKSARPISSLTGHGGKELTDILAIILWRDYHSVVENNRPIKVQPF